MAVKYAPLLQRFGQAVQNLARECHQSVDELLLPGGRILRSKETYLYRHSRYSRFICSRWLWSYIFPKNRPQYKIQGIDDDEQFVLISLKQEKVLGFMVVALTGRTRPFPNVYLPCVNWRKSKKR